MLTFHFGPLSRRARMFLHLVAGCLGLGVLIGPTLLALANSPPIAAATSWTPVRLLAVKPFHDLSGDTCMGDPPLHAGPIAVQGRLVGRADLQRRLAGAVFACAADGWTGGVTIAATVDAPGAITGVHLEGDASPVMQRCLRVHLFHDDPIATPGPGTLYASFFMGQRRTR
jgi:hypothetical protein